MQTVVKDQVENPAIEEVSVPEVPASIKKKEAALLLENFMTSTNQGLNTYRVKRETTFNNFKAALLVYLDEQVSQNKISGYTLNLEQSGAKKMGIYIVGNVVLSLNGEDVDVRVKLHMNGWIESKKVIDAAKAKTSVEPTTEETTA